MLFQFSDKFFDTFKYFELYRFARCTGIKPVRKALGLHRCSGIDWMTSVLQDRLVSWHSNNEELLDLKEEATPASKHALVVGAAPTSVNLPTFHVEHRNGVYRDSLEWMRRDYAAYRGVRSGSSQVSWEAGAGSVRLEWLLEQELLLHQAADIEDVIRDALLSL